MGARRICQQMLDSSATGTAAVASVAVGVAAGRRVKDHSQACCIDWFLRLQVGKWVDGCVGGCKACIMPAWVRTRLLSSTRSSNSSSSGSSSSWETGIGS